MLASFCKMAKVDAHYKSIFNCLKDILFEANILKFLPLWNQNVFFFTVENKEWESLSIWELIDNLYIIIKYNKYNKAPSPYSKKVPGSGLALLCNRLANCPGCTLTKSELVLAAPSM